MDIERDFIKAMNAQSIRMDAISRSKGFTVDNIAEKLCLIHSEISEALECVRSGFPRDNHLPDMDGFTIELADAVIRIMQLSAALNLPLGEAIIRKAAFNETRPAKHGRAF